MFGTAPIEPEHSKPQASKHQTIAFGSSQPAPSFGVPANAPNSLAPPPSIPSPSQTIMFGATPASAPAAAARAQNTVLVTAQKFKNAPSETIDDGDDPDLQTQRFAMSDVGDASAPSSEDYLEAKPNRTQLFAMSSIKKQGETPISSSSADVPRTDQVAIPPDLIGDPATISLNAVARPIREDDDPTTAENSNPMGRSSDGAKDHRTETDPSALLTTAPHGPVTPVDELRALLPQEPGEDVESAPTSQTERDVGPFVPHQPRRTLWRALGVVGAFAVGGAAVPVVQSYLAKAAIERTIQVARQATEQALSLLRLDDANAHRDAVASLREACKKAPQAVEPRAGLVVAEALRFDDLAQEVSRKRRKIEELRRVMEAMDDTSAEQAVTKGTLQRLRADSEAKETLLREQKARLGEELEALDALSGADGASVPAQKAALRAQALARAVNGDAQSMELAEQYRQKFSGPDDLDDPDDWIDLVLPEYVAGGGRSYAEAHKVLETIKSRPNNSTFIRPYVLSARIHLQQGSAAEAKAQLEHVLAMNDKHEVAMELLEWLRTSGAAR
jgi:tetratricopeptide (TPR) repeat protein